MDLGFLLQYEIVRGITQSAQYLKRMNALQQI